MVVGGLLSLHQFVDGDNTDGGGDNQGYNSNNSFVRKVHRCSMKVNFKIIVATCEWQRVKRSEIVKKRADPGSALRLFYPQTLKLIVTARRTETEKTSSCNELARPGRCSLA